MEAGYGRTGQKACVFCLSGSSAEGAKDDILCLSSINGFVQGPHSFPSCSLLDTEMKVVFITRKLLGLEKHQCQEMLERFGSPSTWLAVCKACVDMVNEALGIYEKIVQLERELKALMQEAYRKIGKSNGSRLKRRLKITEASATIRHAVLNNEQDTAETSSKTENEIKEEDNSEGGMDLICKEKLNSLSDPDYIPDEAELEFQYDETEDYTGAVINENASSTRNNNSKNSWKHKRKQTLHILVDQTRDSETVVEENVGVDSSGIDEVEIKVEDGEQASYYKCSKCAYKNLSRFDLLRHMRNIHGCYSKDSRKFAGKDRRRKCVICDQVFTTTYTFHNHCINQHKMMTCVNCPRLFSTISGLHAHQKKHKNTTRCPQKYSCPHCNFCTTTIPYLNQHRRVMHGELTSRMVARAANLKKCSDCNMAFESVEAFRAHCINDHHMVQCPRPECQILFPTLTRLESHQKRHSTEPKQFLQCVHCHYKSDRRVLFNRHLREVHWERNNKMKLSVMKKIKCSQCHQVCKSMDVLRKHCLEIHDMKKCFKCPKLFETEERLGRHIREYHGTIKKRKLQPVHEVHPDKTQTCKCPYCHFYCTSKFRMKCHIRNVHKELAAIDSGNPTAENLQCEKCFQQFCLVEELIQHKIDVHEMVKCDKCLRVFPYVGNLEVHMKKYHREDAALKVSWKWKTKREAAKDAPTAGNLKKSKVSSHSTNNCKMCDETFSSSQDLKTHQSTVHADKMLCCDQCSERFDSMASIFCHQVNFHNQQKSLYNCPLVARGPLSRRKIGQPTSEDEHSHPQTTSLHIHTLC